MQAATLSLDTKPTPAPDVATIQEAICRHVKYSQGKSLEDVTTPDLWRAVSLAVREQLIELMLNTEARYEKADAKRLYYLSMEFLMGRSLGNNLLNLGLYDLFHSALSGLGYDLEEVRESESDAALGNGGLGRLAACFLDSLATLDMPGFGYGINYEYGLFKQEIDNGFQKEKPDNWLAAGTPWEIERPDEAVIIPLYGKVDHALDRFGQYNPMWMDWQVVVGVPHDMPVAGYGGRTVNYLRLYTARSSHDFDMSIFNEGDYFKAVEQKIASETLSKVLYPSDSIEAGRELRLVQEYFFVACAIRDIVRRYEKRHSTFDEFPEKVAIQLNDTHPALAVAELMRLLVDEKAIPWEHAWTLTQATLGYTNHTLMPEALEKWSVSLFERVLPRHLQIIYEINARLMEKVEETWPGDEARRQRMSLISDGSHGEVRMANLALVGSHSINGVAALHSELVKQSLMPDFYQLWPERFNNKTNGVTPRRWLLKANPRLSELLSSTLGDGWITDLDQLRGLEQFAADRGFQEAVHRIKYANKARLAEIIRETTRVKVDPESLFDVQVKRMHEYKRQLLNALHIIYDYLCLIEDGEKPIAPRTYVFAGKAAPGYWAAKQIIKLINNLGKVINHDPRVKGLINVIFLPDYRVSLAERIIPAADLSEQISTAGKEASGTGNMKFAMNGALTIGTLDGANIEILEEVGADNIFIFGLTAEAIAQMRAENSYDPGSYLADPRIKRVVDALNSDLFCPGEPGLFSWISQKLLNPHDEYFHLADLSDYLNAHTRAAEEFMNRPDWTNKAILNIARMGKFSSDRTIQEYAKTIWHIERH